MSVKFLQIDDNTDESQIDYLQNLIINSKCNKSFYETFDTGISAKFVLEGTEHNRKKIENFEILNNPERIIDL